MSSERSSSLRPLNSRLLTFRFQTIFTMNHDIIFTCLPLEWWRWSTRFLLRLWLPGVDARQVLFIPGGCRSAETKQPRQFVSETLRSFTSFIFSSPSDRQSGSIAAGLSNRAGIVAADRVCFLLSIQKGRVNGTVLPYTRTGSLPNSNIAGLKFFLTTLLYCYLRIPNVTWNRRLYPSGLEKGFHACSKRRAATCVAEIYVAI